MLIKKIVFVLMLVIAIATSPAAQAEEDCLGDCAAANQLCYTNCMAVYHDNVYCVSYCGPSYSYCVNCLCGFLPGSC